MTYDISKFPKWATIEIVHDEYWSLDNYDDECITDEFRRKVEREDVWFVGIKVRDRDTGDTNSLWGIETETMCGTECASFDDLDEHGIEIVFDLAHDIARTRLQKLTEEAARFAALAAAEVAS